MAQFSLESFDFIRLTIDGDPGNLPPVITPIAGMTQRPGVDGTGVFDHGTKGMPFQAESLVDVDSHETGHFLADDYRELILSGPLSLVYAGVDYEVDFETNYLVLDVKPINVRTIGASAGGLSGNAGAVVRATWKLLPISSNQEFQFK
jgi:hypothetical protein